MKRFLLSAAAVVALGGAAVLVAHAASTDGDRGRPMRLMQYDGNKDGSITRAEVDQAIAADFKTADKNANGSIDETEFKAFHEDRRAQWKAQRQAAEGEKTEAEKTADAKKHEGRRGMRGDRFKRVDWNLDGSLSQEEFGDSARMMAARIDRDGDGTITAEEREHRRGWRHRDRDKDGDKTQDQGSSTDQKE
jgi:hypothetical protein